jgi:hypothetical protein
MRRMNTRSTIDVCRSIHSKAHQAVISSPQQCHLECVNPLLIQVICPAMINNS